MAINPQTGLNVYNLIILLENLSQLQIGPNENTDDISQDLVIQFLKEGFLTIVDSEVRWPWFESNYVGATVNGGPTVTSFTMTQTFSPYVTVPQTVNMNNIDELINVISIQGPEIYQDLGVELIYVAQHQAERYWVGSNNQTGIPAYFSLWANQLYLWPRPNQIYTLLVRGYREPNLSWLSEANQSNPASTDYVDLDDELQACLISYAMSRIYQFQEDAEMAAVYMNQFTANLKNYQDYLTAPSSNQPLVYSGGLQLQGMYGYGYGIPGMKVLPSSSAVPRAIAW